MHVDIFRFLYLDVSFYFISMYVFNWMYPAKAQLASLPPTEWKTKLGAAQLDLLAQKRRLEAEKTFLSDQLTQVWKAFLCVSLFFSTTPLLVQEKLCATVQSAVCNSRVVTWFSPFSGPSVYCTHMGGCLWRCFVCVGRGDVIR